MSKTDVDRLAEPITLSTPPPRQAALITPARVGWTLVVLASLLTGLSFVYVHPVLPLAAIVALVGILLLGRYPVLGVIAYLVFEYARIPAMFPVLEPLNLGKLIVVATAVAWIARMIIRQEFRFVRDRTNLVLGAWVVLALVSSVDALRQDLALQGTIGLAKFVTSYYLIMNLVTDMQKWRWCMWILLLLHAKMSQFQLRMYAAGIGMTDDRYQFIRGGMGAGGEGGFFGNSTDFGAAICVMIPVAAYLAMASKSRLLKVVAFVSTAMFVVSVLRTGSRGAAVALFAVCCVYWFKSQRKLLVGLAVVVFAAGFWFAAPEEWKTRFIAGAEYQQDATASSRLKFWHSGLEMLIAHPINGVGVDNFTENYRNMGGEGYVAHSIWIEAAAELGVLGIVLVLGAMVLGFARNAQTRVLCRSDHEEGGFITAMSHALDLSLVGYMVAGTFTSILYYPFLFMTLAFVVSLHHIARDRARAI